MGLDMYLTKKTYVKNWNYQPKEARHLVTVMRGGTVRADIRPERITFIIEDVAYWRKANAVHRWFVGHVQQDDDDCAPHAVSRDQLIALRDLCVQVLAASAPIDALVQNGERREHGTSVPLLEFGKTIEDARFAKQLLPTQSGFFFGSTDYDEYYLEDITYTRDVLDSILAEQGDDFVYQSSW